MRAGLSGDNSYPAAHVMARGGFWTRHRSQGDEGFCPHRAHCGRKQTWAQRNEGSGTHSSNALLSLHLTAGLGQPCVPLSGFSLQTVDLAAAVLCSEAA